MDTRGTVARFATDVDGVGTLGDETRVRGGREDFRNGLVALSAGVGTRVGGARNRGRDYHRSLDGGGAGNRQNQRRKSHDTTQQMTGKAPCVGSFPPRRLRMLGHRWTGSTVQRRSIRAMETTQTRGSVYRFIRLPWWNKHTWTMGCRRGAPLVGFWRFLTKSCRMSIMLRVFRRVHQRYQ